MAEFKQLSEIDVSELLKRVEQRLAHAPQDQEPVSPNQPAPGFVCSRCGNRGVFQAAIRGGLPWYKRCRQPACVAHRKAQRSQEQGSPSTFIDQQEKSGRDTIL
jgi:hypothetical protein